MIAVLNSSLDAVIAFDEVCKVVLWNRTAEELFGYHAREVVGRTLPETLFRGAHDVTGYVRLPLQPNPDSPRQRVRLDALHRNGGRTPVEIVVSAATLTTGSVSIAFIRSAEDTKRDEEQRTWLASILQNSGDAIIGSDLSSSITVWNDAATRMFGYDRSEIIGRSSSLLVPSEHREEERETIELVHSGRLLHNYETTRLRKDGTQVDVSISISPISLDDGTLLGTATIIRDITETRLAQKRFELAVEAAPNAMIMVSASGAIELVNAYAERLFGYSRAELLGQPIDILVPERLRDSHPLLGGTFFAQPDTVYLGEGRNLFALRKDGSEFPVEIGLNPVRSRDKLLALCSIVDITARKHAEDYMRMSLREKEQLLKEIHHRVKNNMQVISSLLRLQGEYLQDQSTRQLFRQSDERVRSMALVHERLYRSEVFASIDLKEYVQELADRLFRSYAEGNTRIRLETDLQSAYLGIDKAVPCGLLLNEFISNALKHAFLPGSSGIICITLREENGSIILGVADNGKGLPEWFDLSRPTSFGTEIIRTLRDQLGAELTVQQERGTQFTLRFRSDLSDRQTVLSKGELRPTERQSKATASTGPQSLRGKPPLM
ncbi:MAG: PAS domain S-box protein [Deltaproteobacteria bacterium]|nr:PAS domain S-box protein [Deltaproteobacteria bacterium]